MKTLLMTILKYSDLLSFILLLVIFLPLINSIFSKEWRDMKQIRKYYIKLKKKKNISIDELNEYIQLYVWKPKWRIALTNALLLSIPTYLFLIFIFRNKKISTVEKLAITFGIILFEYLIEYKLINYANWHWMCHNGLCLDHKMWKL